uniref:Uncharacterized protein n=1 Tax=Plectus sambesii TaxID=2011161 RepID=A0A914VCU5_9BILA
MRRLRAYSAILYILLWISFAVVVESQYRDVQPTCLDHFFVGQRKSGIRKLGSANRLSNEDANAVLCEMPPSLDPESVVTTTIHSGLENPHGHKMIEQSTVRYQISSLELLRNITKSADSCTQTIKIMLPASYSTNTQPASFESVYGVKSAIQRNGTIELIGKDAGVLHLFPAQNDNHTDSLQPHIRAGPLVCQQKVAIDKDCLFHMADQSTLTLSELQQAGRISFAFRTDQPNTPLLTLKADDNSAIQIDIVQGKWNFKMVFANNYSSSRI